MMIKQNNKKTSFRFYQNKTFLDNSKNKFD